MAQLRYAQATEKLEEMFGRLHAAGDEARAAEAMFWIAYCYEKQRLSGPARRWYKRVLAVYPRSRAARQAAQRVGRLGQPPSGPRPAPR